MIKKAFIKFRAKKLGYPILKVDSEVINIYRGLNNQHTDEDDFTIIRKLSRSWYSGTLVKYCGNIHIKHYGNLEMYVDIMNNELYQIHSNKGKNLKRYISGVTKNFITKLYEL